MTEEHIFVIPDSIHECELLRLDLQEAVMKINSQLSWAADEPKKYSNDWIRRAQWARDVKAHQIKRVEYQLKRLKHEARESLAQVFMNEALMLLDQETRAEIWEAVFNDRPDLRDQVIEV